MGHYSCLCARQLNLSSERIAHCMVRGSEPHFTHCSVRFSPSLDFTGHSCVSIGLVSLSAVTDIPMFDSSQPYGPQKPYQPGEVRTTKANGNLVSAHSGGLEQNPETSLSLMSVPLPLAASQVPLSRASACTAVSGTSRHECSGRRGCEAACVFD